MTKARRLRRKTSITTPKAAQRNTRDYLARIEKHPLGVTRCRDCGIACDELDAINRGYRHSFTLCEFCS